jgi:hypothetical protein
VVEIVVKGPGAAAEAAEAVARAMPEQASAMPGEERERAD